MKHELISGSVIISPEEYAEFKALKEERLKFITGLP